MIATIAKRFTFDAAHSLPTMPEGHKCRRLHGHTYEVEIVLRGMVNKALGIVLDYGEIAKAWQPVHDAVDHRNLDEIIKISSTENLVAWMFHFWAEWEKLRPDLFAPFWRLLHSVKIRESSTTWCEMSKVEYLAFCGEMS